MRRKTTLGGQILELREREARSVVGVGWSDAQVTREWLASAKTSPDSR